MEMTRQLAEVNGLIHPFNNKKKAAIMHWYRYFVKRTHKYPFGKQRQHLSGGYLEGS